MVTKRRTVRQSRNTLQLNQLETRETPAGNVTAALSAGGVLALTGDAAANLVTLRPLQDGIEIIGNAGTLINGQASVILDGTVDGITAVMKEGADVIDIAADAALSIKRNVSFDLGDGANTLRLATSEALSIGGNLIVKAADGLDTIDIDGDLTSRIRGNVDLSLGIGGSDVLIRNIEVAGGAGIDFLAGAGDDLIEFAGVTVSKASSVVAGAGSLAVNVVESAFGSLSFSTVGQAIGDAAGVVVDVVDTTIDGALSLRSGLGIDLDLDDVSMKNLDVSGGSLGDIDIDVSGAVDVAGNFFVDGADTVVDVADATLEVAGNFLVDGADTAVNIADATFDAAGNFIVRGADTAVNIADATVDVAGNLVVRGADTAVDIANATVEAAHNALIRGEEIAVDIAEGTLEVAGNLEVIGRNLVETTLEAGGRLIADGQVFIQSTLGDVIVDASGEVLTVGKNLAVFARDLADITIDTSLLSRVSGQVSFRSGIGDDLLDIASNFDVGKNLSINFGGGDNIIDLGDADGVLKVANNLFIDTLNGIDQITLNRIEVGNVTDIALGAGADILNIVNGAQFLGRVFVDLAAGADVLNFANLVDNTAAVIFSAATFIRTGIGDDFLNLGLSTSAGGSLNTSVVFEAAQNVIDAGLGLNTFVQADAQFDGSLSFLGISL